MHRIRQQHGFTLIELIIAMAVFSFLLLAITQGFLNIIRIYQSGLSSRNTQQNTRFGIEDIIRQARTSSRVVIDAAGPICLYGPSNAVKYYIANDAGVPRLFRGNLNPSEACSASPTSAVALSSTDVHIVGLSGVQRGDTPPSVEITLTIASTSTASELNVARTACNPGPGSQFCSVTTITTTASLRGTL